MSDKNLTGVGIPIKLKRRGIVYCEECKYWIKRKDYKDLCTYWAINTEEMDFCSRGELK